MTTFNFQKQKSRLLNGWNSFFFASLLMLIAYSNAEAQMKPLQPTIASKAVYADQTPPLSEMPVIRGFVAKEDEDSEAEVENELNLKQLRNLQENPSRFSVDPALQSVANDNIPTAKAPIQNFEGINNTYGVYPPDTQGDVGPNHYVQVVNLGFQIFSKTGTSLYGPANLSTIWAGIPAPWNGTNNGDPIVLYDQQADRWMISQFSLPNSTQYAMLIAVSQTNDPTGAWNRYVFQFGNKMPDYPKFGVWNDGYYMAVNQFISGSSWGGVGACAFERSKMLTGDPTAQMIYFDLGASSDPGSMLPSDWDGATTPVANEPNYFTYFNDWSSATDDYLKIWQFHADWTTPANSTFVESASLVTAPFNSTVCSSGNCIPQPGTTVLLEALTDRLMYRLQYRNFGDHRSMVTNHTVEVDGTGHAGVRWYELRNTGSGWSIYQQGTYAPDASHRWMGSVAMNGVGDIGLGYSVSNGTTIYPSIKYTGRQASDPLGQMTYAEQTIFNGSGYQSGSAARWGDYSMMSVDPTDDGTFWYTTEYIQTSGSTPWRTRIASFLLGPVPPVANFSANVTKPCLNSTVIFQDQSAGTPTTWSWTVTPATYSFVDGTTATSQNPHLAFSAYGTYTIALTVTNAQGNNTMTKSNYISVNAANADFTASATTIVVNNSVTFTDASTCGITSRAWDFGAGASPATATTQGPHVVTYSTTGAKTVSLTVNGSVTETKTNFVTVTDPIFNMANSTISTCDGYFYDPGGSAANYSNSQDYTMVFNPSVAGNMLQFVFSEFALETNSTCSYDYLKIYDGPNNTYPLLGTYCGTTSPGTILATNATGSITFVFHSDVSQTDIGWAATISCISGIVANPATFTATAISSNQIDLAWTKNLLSDNIMVLTNSANTFGTPVPGTVYSVGDPVTGGGSVLYKGSANGFSHLALSSNTRYYYKAFSYTAGNNYSSGIAANALTFCGVYSVPVNENFSTSALPGCWTTQISGTGAVDKWTVSNTSTAGGTAYEMKSTYQNINPAITRLVTPPINTVGITQLDLSFRHMLDAYSTGCTLRVQSSSDGITWTNEAWYVATTAANIAATLVNTSVLSNLNSPHTFVAFTIEGNLYNYDYWYIDNVSITSSSKTLNLTLYLEGLYNGSTMNKAQNASGDQFSGTVADQITVELHNATAPYALAGGPYTVNVNTNGTASVSVPAALGSSYYIVVKHRNSIETWNASPISFAAATMSYDFSNSASQAFGSNLKFMAGKYVMYGGDVNQDGLIDSGDMIPVDNNAASFLSGYVATDLNGDGLIDSGDMILLDNNGAMFIAKVTP